MFSQTAEYALRAAVTLAARPDEALTAAELSRQTQIPTDYLFKVMGQLARGGVVTAVRGKRGGYRLSHPPQQTSILDIVNAVDPIPRIHHCPLGRPAHEHALCPLHAHLDATYAQIERTLGERTLHELIDPTMGPDPVGALNLPTQTPSTDPEAPTP